MILLLLGDVRKWRNVSSQERIVTIMLRLMRGEVLNKQTLMHEFNKDESSIRRDISVIKRMFDDVMDEPDVFVESTTGDYRFKSTVLSTGHSPLDDGQLLAMTLILTASRGLATSEMKTLLHQLLPEGPEHRSLSDVVRNPIFEYKGVPKVALTARLARLSQAILKHETISFDHTYHGVTRHFDRRLPTGLYFGDLFFYLIIDGSDEQPDDPDNGQFVRFRLDDMSHITYHGRQPQHAYEARFRGGRLQKHTWYPYLGKPINLEILYGYDPRFVLDRFPDAIVHDEKVDEQPTSKNPYAQKFYHITIPVNDGFGIRMWLLGQAELVKVLAPKYIRDYVIRGLEEGLAHYRHEERNRLR